MAFAENAVMFAFLVTNAGRLFAYLPQIVRIARDRGRAEAVSSSTWILFLVSNMTSALYAGMVAADGPIMLAFGANAACCAAIVGLLAWKRRAGWPCPAPHRG